MGALTVSMLGFTLCYEGVPLRIVLLMWQQRWLLLTPGFQTLLESPASGGEGLSSWFKTVSRGWHSLAIPRHALTLLPGESGLCDWQAHQV